ncbi:hypothetical protein ACOME3_008643 [Neoechinorhynchus agilis]
MVIRSSEVKIETDQTKMSETNDVIGHESSDEEEEEDQIDSEEFAGFICDDDEDEPGEESPIIRRHRRKRQHTRVELDQEDLDLIRENAALHSHGSKRTRRVMIEDSDGEEVHGDHVSCVDETEESQSPFDDGSRLAGDDELPRVNEKAKDLFSWSSRTNFHLHHDYFGDDDREFCMVMEKEWRTLDSKREKFAITKRMADIKRELSVLKMREGDYLERISDRLVPIRPCSKDEILKESAWIYSNVASGNKWKDDVQIIEKIGFALDFFRNQNFEIPFIYHYRKEVIANSLSKNDLWRIYDLDARWCQLVPMCKAMQERINNLINTHGQNISNTYHLNECLSMIDSNSPDEDLLKDVGIFIDLYFGSHTTYRNVRGVYELLQPICNQIGIDPEKFAAAISKKYTGDVIRGKGTKLSPLELARTIFIKPTNLHEHAHKLNDGSAVVSAATSVAAAHLFHYPKVRAALRKLYLDKCTVDVSPTLARYNQLMEIDGENDDPLISLVKSIAFVRKKPLKKFKDDEFLIMHQASKNGLITIKYEFTKHIKDNFKTIVLRRCTDGCEESYQWNVLRSKVVDAIFAPKYINTLNTQIVESLLEKSKDFVIQYCRNTLCERIRYRQCQAAFGRNVWIITYMFGKYGPEKRSATIMILLIDMDGILIDRKCFCFKESFSDIQENVVKFLEEGPRRVKNQSEPRRNPKAIIEESPSKYRANIGFIAADDMDALKLKSIFQEYFPTYIQSVDLVDHFVPRPGRDCHPGTGGKLKEILYMRAITLGRSLNDPLTEYARLFDKHRKILSMDLEHPLQYTVDQDELYAALLKEIKNQVAIVGVDIHRMYRHKHTSHLLGFVSGLGPMKAEWILHKIKMTDDTDTLDDLLSPQIESRYKLLKICELGPIVFNNCAGFLKIDRRWLDSDLDINVLDCTRAHPEAYEWASKMANDALDGYAGVNIQRPANYDEAPNRVAESPECMKDLDLEAFADMLARAGYGRKTITLQDIRDELLCCYLDRRPQAKLPTLDQEVFYCLGSGTDMIFMESGIRRREGAILQATVIGYICKPPLSDSIDQMEISQDLRTKWFICPLCSKLADNFVAFEKKEECVAHMLHVIRPFEYRIREHRNDSFGNDGGGGGGGGGCIGLVTGVKVRVCNLARFTRGISSGQDSLSSVIQTRHLIPHHMRSTANKVEQNQWLRQKYLIGSNIFVRVSDFDSKLLKLTVDIVEVEPYTVIKDSYYDREAAKRFFKDEEAVAADLKKSTMLKKPKTTQKSEKLSSSSNSGSQNSTIKLKRKSTQNDSKESLDGHGIYHDINNEQAERLLGGLNTGAALIRPSSQHREKVLVLMIKISETVCKSFRVEKDEMWGEMGFVVDTQRFSSFEEIESRFVFPLNTVYKDLFLHKSYRSHRDLLKAAKHKCDDEELNGLKIETEDDLLLQCRKYFEITACPENTRYARYLLTLSVKHVGNVMIACYYLRSDKRLTLRHHYAVVKPTGFGFRRLIFETCDRLICAVKSFYTRQPLPAHHSSRGNSIRVSQLPSSPPTQPKGPVHSKEHGQPSSSSRSPNSLIFPPLPKSPPPRTPPLPPPNSRSPSPKYEQRH